MSNALTTRFMCFFCHHDHPGASCRAEVDPHSLQRFTEGGDFATPRRMTYFGDRAVSYCGCPSHSRKVSRCFVCLPEPVEIPALEGVEDVHAHMPCLEHEAFRLCDVCGKWSDSWRYVTLDAEGEFEELRCENCP